MKITKELAELSGIHAGDGYLRKTKNEVEISGSVEEKSYYEEHVIPLINNTFNTKIKGKKFPTKKHTE